MCQAHWRKLQEEGLGHVYEVDEEFALQARYFSALAFLPVHRVIDGFNAIVNSPAFDQRLAGFAGYVQVA